MATQQEIRTVPSDAAVDRLADRLGHRIDLYVWELDTDLDGVCRAGSSNRDELAVTVMLEHIERLQTFSDEVKRLVADAVVEREAEGVVDAVAQPQRAPVGTETTRPGRALSTGLGVALSLLAAAILVLPQTAGTAAPAGDGLDSST